MLLDKSKFVRLDKSKFVCFLRIKYHVSNVYEIEKLIKNRVDQFGSWKQHFRDWLYVSSFSVYLGDIINYISILPNYLVNIEMIPTIFPRQDINEKW